MTISDLGSIGELIAAAATVATLLYLALQVRANTNTAKYNAINDIDKSHVKKCKQHLLPDSSNSNIQEQN